MSTLARLACRFRASWEEGHEPARESFHAEAEAATAAGMTPPEPPAEVLRAARERSEVSDELREVLRLSRARQLPSLYDPSGVAFPETVPIYLDHVGAEVGRVLVVSRTADRFEVLGWVHPDHADTVRACRHVSPGLWIDAATIQTVEGRDVLAVSASTVVELSATAEPARFGTFLEVGRPRLVPSPDWEALQTVDSAFDAWRIERARASFAAA